MSVEIKENEVVWIDGLNPVLDFINMIQKENPEGNIEIIKELFDFMRRKDLDRKNYNVVFDDKELFITVVKLGEDDFRLVVAYDIDLINIFLLEEANEGS